jgi:DNA-binding SARP family transcriptional activator
LAEDALARGDTTEALDYSLRLVAEDRAHETGTRLVMRSFVACGRRGAALAAYDALAAYLDHHLALQPASETVELRAAILKA